MMQLRWPLVVFILAAGLAHQVDAMDQPSAVGEAQFLAECESLARKRGLHFIAVYPGKPPLDVPSSSTRVESWRDHADAFALRWRATWKVAEDYLLVGRQYSVTEPGASKDLWAFAHHPPTIAAMDFLGSLPPEQVAVLRHKERLPLDMLSEKQCEYLTQGVVEIPQFPILPLTSRSPGYVRVTGGPISAWVCSNGRVVGRIGTEGEWAVFEPLDYWGEQPGASQARGGVTFSQDGLLTSLRFAQAAALAFAGTRDVSVEETLPAPDARVATDSARIPLRVALQFVRWSLDYDIREEGTSVRLAPRNSLPSEAVEEANTRAYQVSIEQCRPALAAVRWIRPAGETLWNTVPDLYLRGRSRFRIEFTPEAIAWFGSIDSRLRRILAEDPKVAIEPAWALNTAVTVVEDGAKPRRTAASLTLMGGHSDRIGDGQQVTGAALPLPPGR